MTLTLPMNAPAPTDRLERYRHYLTLLARMEVGPGNLRYIDASGIVNATLFTAQQQWDQFRGTNDAQLAAWLRRMLACNLADEFRRIHRRKRDVSRERSLEVSLDQSRTVLEDWLIALQTSPSARVIKNEQLMRLAWALGVRAGQAIKLGEPAGGLMPLADVETWAPNLLDRAVIEWDLRDAGAGGTVDVAGGDRVVLVGNGRESARERAARRWQR